MAEAQKQIFRLEQDLQQAALAEKSASIPLRGRIDPRTLATQVRFSQVMSQKLARIRQDLEASRRDLATAHAALIEAAKGRKVLEKLHEKQQQRWLAEQQKHEEIALDDLSQRMTREQNHSTETFPSSGA